MQLPRRKDFERMSGVPLRERLKQYKGLKETTQEASSPEEEESWAPPTPKADIEEDLEEEIIEEIEEEIVVEEEEVLEEDVETGGSARGSTKASNGSSKRCLWLLVLVVLLAIAALILALVVDWPLNDDSTREIAPTPVPAPTAAGPTPTAPTPTAPTDVSEAPVPSPSPTTLRLGLFIDNFVANITGYEVLEDRTSPQFLAAEFIADVDDYAPELLTIPELEDRYAATTLYFATLGDGWDECSLGDTTCTSPWLTGDHCGWFAISCNEAGHISSIDFSSDNGLAGSLPPEVYLFSDLEEFAIVDNMVGGTVPDTISLLTNLTALNLEGNAFTGSISPGICALTNTTLVELSADCEEVSCSCCTACEP